MSRETFRDKVIEALEKSNLANFEISEETNIEVSTVRKIISDLKKEGIVADADEMRHNDGGSRPYKVYQLIKHSDKSDLLFLMTFFQNNSKILMQHNQKFFVDNQKRFISIAGKFNGGND